MLDKLSKLLDGKKTFIGAGTAVIASLVNALTDISVDGESQTAITDFVLAIISGVGGLVAIYGRLKATKVKQPKEV